MTTEAVIRTVGRCALNLDTADRMLSLLEENLFTEVISDVDAGVVPSVVGRALLKLYSEVQEGRDAQASARTAFDEIRLDPAARMSCPIEAVIAALEGATAGRQIAYGDAQNLASLPWSNLSSLVPHHVALSAENFRIEIEGILHEAEEGFVGPGTVDPDVTRSAAILASDLRACKEQSTG